MVPSEVSRFAYPATSERRARPLQMNLSTDSLTGSDLRIHSD